MEHELVIGKYTLESLTNGMYASPLDMFREYIQNSVDSFDDAVARKIERENSLRIDINVDSDNRVISIRDNGSGIPAEEAVATLLDIGNSQKSRSNFRGFRGIGRLAGLSYCDKLTFKTSSTGEKTATIIEFDSALLRELLLPGTSGSVKEVIDQIVTVRTEQETPKRRYFEVLMEGVDEDAGLMDIEDVKEYLVQHAPLFYDDKFKWGRTIYEKVRMEGYLIPQYRIFFNNIELVKPYQDVFVSDRVKKNEDSIKDIEVKAFYRGENLSAILWFAYSNFYGTILENTVKGIRIRQGNILIGDKVSCNQLFKEERFNGWLIGELHVIDKELIANSRRDGFEKNAAYYELIGSLKEWAFAISKEIRHISYERSLSATKKAIVEAEGVDELDLGDDLYSDELGDDFDVTESSFMNQSESEELSETDYFSKLSLLIDQKKAQTKYAALNINPKLTMEQRHVLERVFDLITQEYEQEDAEGFVNLIANKF